MMALVLMAGGALGTLARFGLGSWVGTRWPTSFPWGTFLVNALGSLLIGFAVRWLDSTAASAELRGFLLVGLLGGFTTFSTFSLESLAMLRERQWLAFSGYSIGSVVTGILCVAAGFAAAGLMLRLRTA